MKLELTYFTLSAIVEIGKKKVPKILMNATSRCDQPA